MPKDLLNSYIQVRQRLLDERSEIIERLEVLDGFVRNSAIRISPPVTMKYDRPRKSASVPAVNKAQWSTKTEYTIPDKWSVVPEAYDFPVVMFPFPSRALTAFAVSGILKLVQLNNMEPESLGNGKNVGGKTLQAITDLINRVNRGELFYPVDQALPIHDFVPLIDFGLVQLDEPAAFTFQNRMGHAGDPMTLDAIGLHLGITKERVRQLENETLLALTRMHGAKLYQIGKALSSLSKTRPIEFHTISDPAHAPKFSAEFYFAILGRMFPGLKLAPLTIPETLAPTTPSIEPPPSSELRRRIFGE